MFGMGVCFQHTTYYPRICEVLDKEVVSGAGAPEGFYGFRKNSSEKEEVAKKVKIELPKAIVVKR